MSLSSLYSPAGLSVERLALSVNTAAHCVRLRLKGIKFIRTGISSHTETPPSEGPATRSSCSCILNSESHVIPHLAPKRPLCFSSFIRGGHTLHINRKRPHSLKQKESGLVGESHIFHRLWIFWSNMKILRMLSYFWVSDGTFLAFLFRAAACCVGGKQHSSPFSSLGGGHEPLVSKSQCVSHCLSVSLKGGSRQAGGRRAGSGFIGRMAARYTLLDRDAKRVGMGKPPGPEKWQIKDFVIKMLCGFLLCFVWNVLLHKITANSSLSSGRDDEC